MRVDVLLLASLPSALAGRLAYTPPADLLAKVAANDDCVLPGNYKIKGFSGQSNDTENTLGSFNFRFIDSETKIESLCHFNSSSESTTPGGLTPRYPCENGEVKFIWEDDERSLWMIERVCPGEDGKATYEVSGSVSLPLACGTKGDCVTNSTTHTSKFTSIQPVRDPTRLF